MRLHLGTGALIMLLGCATGANQPDAGANADAGPNGGPDAAPGPGLTVLAPNGGELWINGATVSIEWVPADQGTVEIELLRAGSPVSVLASGAPDTGSLDWTIPINLEASADYRVRVSATDQPASSDASDADFTIELRQLTVTTPNGGEAVVAGEPLAVQWTSSDNIATVDLFLLADGVEQQPVATAIANDGEHSWTPPFDLPAGVTYGVRVRDADSIAFDDSDSAFTVRNWQYRRAITITAPGGALSSWPVLVELDAASFDFATATADGSDLRFATTPDRSSGIDLAHWIEAWNSGASARVWVRVPSVPAGGSTTIYLFHGMPGATSTSTQDGVFPSRWVSTDSVTLAGQQSFDLFHLQPGHTLTIQTGQVLRIDARIVIIQGAIAGNGAGHAGGSGAVLGSGPGGGGASTDSGAGGGGHGGTGGRGGYDAGDAFGAGGVANGNTTDTSIDMGSGGGGTDNENGGRGGGGVSIMGHTVTVSGAITVDGAAGGGGSGRNGGGGAGGGVTIAGYDVSVSSALRARGGKGGDGDSSVNDGGGGGGGGRIKVLYARNLADTATRDVTGGAGGLHGGAAQGQAGGSGTSHTGTFTGIEPDVSVSTATALY